jgi:ribosomal protein S18 acetylase RimI-like enzyme
MNTPDVRTAKAEDQDRVVDAIVIAFARDPVARWLWPEPHQYLTHFGPFTKAFCGRAFEHDSAYHTVDFSAAALWLPPGVLPDDDAVDGVLERSIEPKRLKGAVALFEQMGSYHPADPHWYLPEIGVDLAKQGRGSGAALLRYALDRVDREGKTAYLENTNPANTPLYERHGFEVIGTIQVDDAPPVLPMVRGSR